MRKLLLAGAILFGLYYIFLLDTIPDGWVMLFKLIPMVLIILYALTTPHRDRRYDGFICTGLIFCAIGDYTLQWFIVGLSFFLLGHIFYITAFSKGLRAVPTTVKFLLLTYGVAMAVWMSTTLLKQGEFVLAFAVIAYITVILTMGWMAFRTGITYAIIGALLFIASDTMLAINKFIVNIPFAHELIMLTYYGAQIFIVLSMPKYFEFRNKVIK